ncbi:MAG: ATP-dependent Clp protease ATP-binding subunit [Verrucomicrobia bacterium]|nr:ATP-dependent Clp protease ATP-binding subunit [Verrucomicrobiota bacterium]
MTVHDPSIAPLRQVVSEALLCQPSRDARGTRWEVPNPKGIRAALLHDCPSGERRTLDVVLARVSATATLPLHGLWEMVAAMVKETDLAAVPVAGEAGPDGLRPITVRITFRGAAALDLPRLNRLSRALELLDQMARTLHEQLPAAALVREPRLPAELRELCHSVPARVARDSGAGASPEIVPLLQAGLSVALVGSSLRVRLELDRLARLPAVHLAQLQFPTPIQRVPPLAAALDRAGWTLAAPCASLRPRVSVYEQGREIEAALQELAARGVPAVFFGTREELESVFGVGQGRSHNAMHPVIQALAPAEAADLVRVAFAGRAEPLPAAKADRLAELVCATAAAHGGGSESLLQPLANLAANGDPDDPALPLALKALVENLAVRRDTFGICAEAPAQPRDAAVRGHLMARLGEEALADRLGAGILGQEPALREVADRLFREALCRSDTEPLRLLVAGPVGTGKSMVTKSLAEWLDWPHHVIDAGSFDSEHAVMSSLAGVAPGIVSSFNDGVLARIARRPSVVEVADLDHARPGVRGSLCDFFLRILQEGTLQTGSGAIIRTLPHVIFLFTSNVAFGRRGPEARLGFGALPTRDEVRAEVSACASEFMGPAFLSRVGQPILFAGFTPVTARLVAEREIRSLVARVTAASVVEPCPEVAAHIVASLANLDTGARGIVNAARDALTGALRGCVNLGGPAVAVRLEEGRIVVARADPARGGRGGEPAGGGTTV